MPRLSDSLVCIDIDDHLVVHVPETRAVIVLNPAAKRVTELCDGVTPFSSALRTLAVEWNVNVDELKQDVKEIIRDFIKEKIAEYGGRD